MGKKDISSKLEVSNSNKVIPQSINPPTIHYRGQATNAKQQLGHLD
jgi:hypothetical protein